jgi:hypothetical protein
MFRVNVTARMVAPFVELVSTSRVDAVARAEELTLARLGSHVTWNVNSTSSGAGYRASCARNAGSSTVLLSPGRSSK